MPKKESPEARQKKDRLLELLYQYYYDSERRCKQPSGPLKEEIASLLIELQKKGVSYKFLDSISKCSAVNASNLPRKKT
jgi:hypothetical protein